MGWIIVEPFWQYQCLELLGLHLNLLQRLMGNVEGRILKYGFAPDPGGGIVSFASMAFQQKH